MKKELPFSLRQKLLVSFIILLIIPLLISGLLVYHKSTSFLLSKEMRITRQMMNEISEKINDYLLQLEQLSFDVAYNPSIQYIVKNYMTMSLVQYT